MSLASRALLFAVLAGSSPAASHAGQLDDWLSLLAPIHDTIFGTAHGDTLAAAAEGDVVVGLSGKDTLSSTFNRTALIGNSGDDALTTDVLAAGDTVHGLAVQAAGSGDDVLQASLGVGGGEGTAEVLLDSGPGGDGVEAKAYSMFPIINSIVSTLVYGRGGDDVIHAVADATGTEGTGVATNTVHGGEGSDRITAYSVTEFNGGGTQASNVLSGDNGDDVLDATAIAESNESMLAANSLLGGRGDDLMRAFCLTDSNHSSPVGLNELSGGNGNDDLEAIHSTDGENGSTDLTSILEGGNGQDRLRADSTALGGDVLAVHRLEGGAGHDMLTARLDSSVSFFNFDVSNMLDGGPGSDHLEAWLAADCTDEETHVRGPCPPFHVFRRAENHLDGGPGSDVLLATVSPIGDGSSFLDGGPGHDELTVVGGSGNVLDGGTGHDDLFAGASDDWLIGGIGSDTFHFDLSQDQGTDSVGDFEPRHDAVSFAGLPDEGAPGLVDDLDAISTFTDPGPGSDLIIDLVPPGTRIVFVGRGTGGTASWGGLLSHP